MNVRVCVCVLTYAIKLFKNTVKPHMVVHAHHPSTQETVQKESEFEANLSYVVSEKEGPRNVAKSACLVRSRSWVCSASLGGRDDRGRALTLEQSTYL